MNTQEELFKKIRADKASADELLQAWEKGAGAQEIADILAGKGIEVSMGAVEDLLAWAQKDRADAIESQELDIDELNRLAGGGNGKCDGAANCDAQFINYPKTPRDKRCTFAACCDEMFFDTPCYNNEDGPDPNPFDY